MAGLFWVKMTLHQGIVPCQLLRRKVAHRVTNVFQLACSSVSGDLKLLSNEQGENVGSPLSVFGFDHGVGHSLLLLYDAKTPRGQKIKEFKGLGRDPSNTSISLF